MTNSQRLATVRARLQEWLEDHSSAADAATYPIDNRVETPKSNLILRESILIRDEFYCGRRFHAADHHAIWFIEEDQLKIYGNDGLLQCVLSGTDIDSPAEAQEHGAPDIIKLPLPAAREDHGDEEVRRAA